MTRKSPREIERAVRSMQPSETRETGLTVVIRRDRVNADGETVETDRRLIEL